MDNNSNTLLGWEAVADALSSETLNNPLVTGTFSTGNDDISDDEIKRLQRTNRGPSVKEVFGIDTSKEEKDTEVEETEETEEETEIEEEEVEVEEPKKKSKGKVITRKPILPSEQEMEENPRSKSAKLRIFERKL